MTCLANNWMYGNKGTSVPANSYGTLTRIKTPASLPSTGCLVAYFSCCRSTNLSRFYQATIAYTATAGYWHFSWGYSPDHLYQPPFTGLTPAVNHEYELGIRFTGSVVEAYVIDLATSISYTMGSLTDNGRLVVGDNGPGFSMESNASQISEANVDAFKAYKFHYFVTPTSSTEWPHSLVHTEHADTIPSQIHTYHQGSHNYLVGKTTLGSQLTNDTVLW